jgi:hypothetical protein
MATATRKRSRRATATGKPVLQVEAVDVIQDGADNDWYTPKVLKLSPLKVRAAVGKKGKTLVACEIMEESYEHTSVAVRLEIEGSWPGSPHLIGWHSSAELGPVGSFTPEALDQVIATLQTARDEAQRRGFFTARAAPSTMKETLQLVGDILRQQRTTGTAR